MEWLPVWLLRTMLCCEQLLWREMLRAAQQTLVIFAVFLAVLYVTGNKMPWDARAPAESRPVSKLRLEDEY